MTAIFYARFPVIGLLAICGLCVLAGDAHAQGSVETDRAELETLYYATNGGGWTNNTNWLSDAPLSDWFGVTTDASGRVTGLVLDGNALSGTIPSTLENLAFLEVLRLEERWDSTLQRWVSNTLSGPIPASLGNLASLQFLDLSENELSGPIPASLGNLANLQFLDLGRNELSGPIPASSGNLASLQSLDLSENELSGPIPASSGNLASLQFLDLSENELNGPIPASLGNLANLQSLGLGRNELSGPIPGSLGDLTLIESLDIENNELTGLIPAELLTLASLENLDLSHNRLSGLPSTPSSIEALVQWLVEHGLSGWIQAVSGNMVDFSSVKLSAIKTLDLSHNSLTGSIPASFGNLSALMERIPTIETLDLSATGLRGEMPLTMMSLSELSTLRIENSGLCVPADAAFQAWVASIDFRGIICGLNLTPEQYERYRNTWRGAEGPPMPSEPAAGTERSSRADAFTDHPIRPATTPLKVVHFRELRERIAVLRGARGLPAVQWTDPSLTGGVTPVKRVHLSEMRAALDGVYDAVERPRPSYTDAALTAGATAIRAVHVMELRAAVTALE